MANDRMANDEHVRRVLQGAGEDRDLSALDLRGADLKGALLRGASMAYTDFTGADLEGASFHGVDLEHANFGGARIHRARFLDSPAVMAGFAGAELFGSAFYGASLNLRGVDFRSARLTACQLDGADLPAASLQGAVLRQVSLRGANLEKTALELTVITDCDLTAAAVERAEHLGPSVLDDRTLRRSGSLPQAFLRGCGHGEGPIDDVYVAYVPEDRDVAHRLRADLQAAGIRCWSYPLGPEPAEQRWSAEASPLWWDRVLLVLSETSQYLGRVVRLAVQTLDGWPDRAVPNAPYLLLVQVDRGSGGHVTDLFGRLPREDLSSWRSDPAAYAQAVARLVARIRAP
jgi:hypothetical protein